MADGSDVAASVARDGEGCAIDRGPAAGPDLLTVWGDFPPWWLGAIAGGLSRLGADIVRGFAGRSAQKWLAQLEVQGLPVSDSIGADILAVARARVYGCMPRVDLSLYRFDVARQPQTGALRLELEAQDSTGFLAILLDRLASLTLFPTSVTIATRGNRIADTLELVGISGRPPSLPAEQSLKSTLDQLTLRGVQARSSASVRR
jgi:hypothetical protein